MAMNYPYPWQFLPCSTFNMYPLHPDSLASSQSSESSSSMAKKRKRTLWSEAEEKILIDLCKKSREAQKGNGISQKGNEIAWNRLSKEVNYCSSFNMGTRCRDKWHNLFNSFTKAKDSSTKTEGDTTKMKYFKHFESYCALNIKNIYLPTQLSLSVYQLIIFPSGSNDQSTDDLSATLSAVFSHYLDSEPEDFQAEFDGELPSVIDTYIVPHEHCSALSNRCNCKAVMCVCRMMITIQRGPQIHG